MPKISEIEDYAARQKARELAEWGKLINAHLHNLHVKINIGASTEKYTVLDLKSHSIDAKFFCQLSGHRTHAKIYLQAYAEHNASPDLPSL